MDSTEDRDDSNGRAPIAVELLGSLSEIVPGKKWNHHVIHKGHGDIVLMYHGIGGHAETFARTMPAIAAAGYHVYAVDALFHGYSSKPSFPADPWRGLEAQVDAVVDLLDALGVERAHFIGESMGAGMGLSLGLRYPERLSSVILNGFGAVNTERPATDFPPALGPSMAQLVELSEAAITDPSYDNIQRRLHWLVRDPNKMTHEMVLLRQRLYQDPEINASMRQVFRLDSPPLDMAAAMRQAPTEAEIRAAWKTKALVVWGDHNPGSGAQYGAYCADMIGAQFYEFVETGHWPQWERPEEYVKVVTDFLASV